jgi:PAS domain-containing protein
MPLLVDVCYVVPVVVAVLSLTHRVIREAATLADLSRQVERKIEERTRELETAVARYRTTLASIGDGLISTDVDGRVEFMNQVAERLTGWDLLAAQGRALDEVFSIVNASTRAKADDPVGRALREGVVVGLSNHTLLIRRQPDASTCTPH